MSGDPLAVVAANRFVPVVTIDDADSALPLAHALVAGGLSVVEVTLRTPAALAAIERLAAGASGAGSEVSEIIVGVGTALSRDDVFRAVDAGASFVVTPALDAEVMVACRDRAVPVVPGIATPSELLAATRLGAETVKVFPAGPLGGPAFVAALAAIWPEVGMIPTGGIGPNDAATYLSTTSVRAVGGSWIAPRTSIAKGEWDLITHNAKTALAMAAAAAATTGP